MKKIGNPRLPDLDGYLDRYTTAPDRPRYWVVKRIGEVRFARHYPVLADGEECTEDTPTFELTAAEWADHHRRFGLDTDGKPLATA